MEQQPNHENNSENSNFNAEALRDANFGEGNVDLGSESALSMNAKKQEEQAEANRLEAARQAVEAAGSTIIDSVPFKAEPEAARQAPDLIDSENVPKRNQ